MRWLRAIRIEELKVSARAPRNEFVKQMRHFDYAMARAAAHPALVIKRTGVRLPAKAPAKNAKCVSPPE